MKKLSVFFLLVLCAVFLLAADQPKFPPMPVAVSSNAVASLKNGIEVYSMMGVGPKKTWDDITNKMYLLRFKSGKWTEGRPVPGVAGRLGASAIGARGQIFVFGGYVVDAQGNEITVADVNSFLPQEQRWYRAADIPVPVDNAVIGLNHDRYIYLVGGRSKNGPVNNVQAYDVEKNTWSQATPLPGSAVFGHAGGLIDDAIVYVDGAKKDPAGGNRYVVSDECWIGKIEKKDPNKIAWSKISAHPGPGRFGIVAGAWEHEHRILFSGGTATVHNFKGLDYDGKLAELSPVTFAFELHGGKWETISEDTFDVRTDGRGIVSTPLGPLIIGGMLKNGAISARVLALQKK
ncbi:MAG TPA: kelch repeat-containing protein [Candidatus Sulfotelmatobacter sp.]|jgi:N-acetylneuraminic acid mutarotase